MVRMTGPFSDILTFTALDRPWSAYVASAWSFSDILSFKTLVRPCTSDAHDYMDVGDRAKHDSMEGGGRVKQEARTEEARAEERRFILIYQAGCIAPNITS